MDYCNLFLPNIGEDQKKVLQFKRRAPGIVSYDKSGPGYCVKFIKSLDEGLRLQLFGEKPLISPGLYIEICWQKLN